MSMMQAAGRLSEGGCFCFSATSRFLIGALATQLPPFPSHPDLLDCRARSDSYLALRLCFFGHSKVPYLILEFESIPTVLRPGI